MWSDFVAQNVHFGLMLYAALAFLGVAWLYFDAWLLRRRKNEIFKWGGALITSLSFFMHAVTIDRDALGTGLFGAGADTITDIVRLIGYLLLAIGIVREPLQEVPLNPGLELSREKTVPRAGRKSALPAMIGGGAGLSLLLPVVSGYVAWLYHQRATRGLERHLKPMGRTFGLIAVAEVIGLRRLLTDVANPTLSGWFAAYGGVWWLQHAVLAVAIFLLCRWVWGYLIERFVSQLVLVFTSMVVVIFSVICVSFTGLLMKSVRSDAIGNLTTASKVFSYALDARQNEMISLGEQLVSRPAIQAAVNDVNNSALASLVPAFMAEHSLTGLIITDESGQVLLRGEDVDVRGDSMSSDRLVRRALLGIKQASADTAPAIAGGTRLVVRSSVPVYGASQEIIGSALLVRDLDAAFVDGLETATGLSVGLYADVKLVASTQPGVGRSISDSRVKDTVLGKSQVASGTFMLNNRSTLAVFTPLQNSDNDTIGMVSLGIPAAEVLRTAGRSVEMTFGVATALLALSFVPTYLVARNLKRQLQ